MMNNETNTDAVFQTVADAVAAKQAHLAKHGIKCRSCGTTKLPDEYGKLRNGKLRLECKICFQLKSDATRANRLGFATVEEMRTHFLERRTASRRQSSADHKAKAKRERAAKLAKKYGPAPGKTPERMLAESVNSTMLATLDKSLSPYRIVSALMDEAALTARVSTCRTFGYHLEAQWIKPNELQRLKMDHLVSGGMDRFNGCWPSIVGLINKPAIPCERGDWRGR